MRWENSTELVRYAVVHYQALTAAGKVLPGNTFLDELPKLEQLGTRAGVTLTRVELAGARWLEATCTA